MKCKKCKSDNNYSYNYCKKCGNKFTKKEQNKAKRWTLVWFLEKKDKIKSLWKFSFITDHILFKIATVLIFLGIGIYSFFTNGINLKILGSDNYKIQYNTKLEEYYLLVNSDNTKLNLYVPEKTNKIIVKHLDNGDKIIDENSYNKGDEITLENNSSNDYYTIKAEYSNKKSDTLKVFIYQEKEDINE